MSNGGTTNYPNGATPELHFDFNEDSAPSDQIDVQHYLRILRKFKWPITFFTALVTALAAYYAYTATPIYRSTAVLLIESQRANIVSIEELWGMDGQNQDYFQTQLELLKSVGLARKVVERMGLFDHPEFGGSSRPKSSSITGDEQTSDAVLTGANDPLDQNPLAQSDGLMAKASGFVKGLLSSEGTAEESAAGAAVEDQASAYKQFVDYEGLSKNSDPEELWKQSVVRGFMGGLALNPVRGTNLVNISYQSSDSVLAAAVANTVAEQYITSYLDSKMEMTSQATTWLQSRLASLKITLDDSEKRLHAYKLANGLIDVNGGVARLNEQKLLIATTELAEAKRQLSDASDLRREVAQMQSSAPALLETLPVFQNDGLVRGVKIEQGQYQRELDELSNRYGARHPKIVDAKSRLESLNTSLQGHISRVVKSIESDYQFLRQRVASIEATLNVGKQEIQEIGSKSFELDSLEREVNTNRNLYDTYFNRMTEAKSADGLETANARLTDPAAPALGPFKPKKQLIIALAALGALIISCLMAFLYEQMDDTISSTADIEKKLGLPLLGILPLIRSGILGRKQALPLNPMDIKDKKGTFFEAVNTARTVLSLGHNGKTAKIITITSSIPGEGKSTSAMNLAFSLAQLENVLLIDCDMRRPSIAKALELPKNQPGLSDLIVGSAHPRDCLLVDAIGPLDVITAGTSPDQPLELISSGRFASMLEQLSTKYDRIVIDSAPTQAVSDALVLGRMSDAVVYVIKSHDTQLPLVERGVARLKQAGAPIAGALITQVDIDKITSYGGDYYYQGYYDYYGYGDKVSTVDPDAKSARTNKIQISEQERIAIQNDRSYKLDFDSEPVEPAPRARAPESRQPEPRQPEPRQKAHRNGYADVGLHESELDFDATTQMPEYRESEPRRTRPTRKFADDLDIV